MASTRPLTMVKENREHVQKTMVRHGLGSARERNRIGPGAKYPDQSTVALRTRHQRGYEGCRDHSQQDRVQLGAAQRLRGAREAPSRGTAACAPGCRYACAQAVAPE